MSKEHVSISVPKPNLTEKILSIADFLGMSDGRYGRAHWQKRASEEIILQTAEFRIAHPIRTKESTNLIDMNSSVNHLVLFQNEAAALFTYRQHRVHHFFKQHPEQAPMTLSDDREHLTTYVFSANEVTPEMVVESLVQYLLSKNMLLPQYAQAVREQVQGKNIFDAWSDAIRFYPRHSQMKQNFSSLSRTIHLSDMVSLVISPQFENKAEMETHKKFSVSLRVREKVGEHMEKRVNEVIAQFKEGKPVQEFLSQVFSHFFSMKEKNIPKELAFPQPIEFEHLSLAEIQKVITALQAEHFFPDHVRVDVQTIHNKNYLFLLPSWEKLFPTEIERHVKEHIASLVFLETQGHLSLQLHQKMLSEMLKFASPTQIDTWMQEYLEDFIPQEYKNSLRFQAWAKVSYDKVGQQYASLVQTNSLSVTFYSEHVNAWVTMNRNNAGYLLRQATDVEIKSALLMKPGRQNGQ